MKTFKFQGQILPSDYSKRRGYKAIIGSRNLPKRWLRRFNVAVEIFLALTGKKIPLDVLTELRKNYAAKRIPHRTQV